MSRSQIITDAAPQRNERMPPIHPGEILLEEFLKPAGLSQNALARAIHVPPRRVNEIVLGKRAITADTALRLARYWGMSDGFFLRLQEHYDLEVQREKLGTELDQIKPATAATM